MALKRIGNPPAPLTGIYPKGLNKTIAKWLDQDPAQIKDPKANGNESSVKEDQQGCTYSVKHPLKVIHQGDQATIHITNGIKS